jgi:hypothetical protein
MTVKISKPAINVREELADLRKPTGIAGEAMLRAETPQEQFNLIGAGRRNLIINGDMRIAQRGTSFTSSGSGLFTLDRWVSGVHTGTGDGNMTQETDAPTAIQSGTAFTHSLKFQVTTANTNIQATDRKYHVYRIEGQDLAPAGFGQAGQRYMTLSFWHKHTKTGTHSLAINNAARNRSYPMEYTQATTNTWEKAELTFPVDTTGTWLGGNGIGMWIFFGAAFGSNYAGTVNQWGSSQKYGTANQVNNYDSTSNSMQFTGVQLELGKVATPFEHRSYSEELAACQRYFQIYKPNRENAVYFSYNPKFHMGQLTLQGQMRTDPTATWYDGNMRFAQVGYNSVSATMANTQAHTFITTGMERQAIHFNIARAAGGSTPTGDGVYNSEGSTARFFIDAEL